MTKHVLVLGAGPTGLVAAMLLAAEGLRVTVLDRDPGPPDGDGEAAWRDWRRPGVGQFRHSHCVLPGGTSLLAAELPGAVDRILALGGRPHHNMIAGAWDRAATGPRQPGDARFETIAMRRPLLDAALLAQARQTPGVTVRHGVQVAGLLTGKARSAAPPHVTGVLTQDGERWAADLVVDAGGRNSPVAGMLAGIGAEPEEYRVGTGFRYYTRYFRSPDGALPRQAPWPLCHHDSVSVLSVPGDRGTWGVSLVTSGRDQEMRALADADAWHRALSLYPWFAHLGEGEPVTGVTAIGGTDSRRRRLVVDGRPLVTGIVQIGDAWGTVDPQFGTGITMGWRHAAALRDVLRLAGSAAPLRQSLLLDTFAEENLTPVWEGFAAWDRNRLAEIDAEIQGGVRTTDDADWNLQIALGSARWKDPEILRGLADVGCLLAGPQEALVKPGLAERAVELAAGEPRYAEPGPSRGELLTAVHGT
ncbi:FAD-dependent monooxygenase [Streptomyces sp. NPDC006140]|uniref:NAD(P)/FAD-dependent oxidoreductase n=1 Tax=Streptomyces sp. NPDC006140 TaxID=3154579 RepID=UPI0033F3F8FC